jgi:hypothetical protein
MEHRDDGITHINIYSKGRTDLGRWLSNFTRAPFVHPVHGTFMSVEGFWYWLGTGNNALRELSGFEAKRLGKATPRTIMLTEEEFKREIYQACWLKLWGNPDKLHEFAESNLPFEHYYVYGGKVVPAGYKWLLEMWELFRAEVRNHTWR